MVIGNQDTSTAGTSAAGKTPIVTGIQFDPKGELLLIVKFRASLIPNKTAGEEESDSDEAAASAAGGTFEGGGDSGDVAIFGGGGSSGDSVVFGGAGGDFTISIPVSVIKA